MIRKLMVTTSLTGLLPGTLAMIKGKTQEPQKPQQPQQQAPKSINGTILDRGRRGRLFTFDTGSRDKQTLKLVVENNTKGQGQRMVGTRVAADYQATSDGLLLSPHVALQG